MPKIQNQLTVSGTKEIKLNSNRPKEMVRKTKTMKPAAYTATKPTRHSY